MVISRLVSETSNPFYLLSNLIQGLPSWHNGKQSACQCTGSIPGLGRSPGGGNGNPLQYSCLENPMDRGAWRGAVPGRGCKESDTTERPSAAHSAFHPLTHFEDSKVLA